MAAELFSAPWGGNHFISLYVLHAGKTEGVGSPLCGHKEQANECIYNKESVAMRERETERV